MRLLHADVGIDRDVVTPAVPRERVQLPPPALPDRLRRRLSAAVGSSNVRRDDAARLRHAAGRSYLDLLALRSGVIAEAPDAVVHPASADEVQRVLRVCAEERCAVVPFGGGTSVVGGVAPLRGELRSVVTVSLMRMASCTDVDVRSQLATLQAGMTGPAAEAALARNGLTLGHYPQSFEYATVGGFAATRSAGQASSGMGRFDELVRGATLIAPQGPLSISPRPPDAAGPSLLQLVLGSEGTLGVITDVTVRVRPRPRFRRYAAWTFADLDSGIAALRELALSRALPDVTRLADEDETRAWFAMAGDGAAARAALQYLRLRGQPAPCMAILGWEAGARDAGARVRAAARALRRHGAVGLGTAPGRAWLRTRFEAPYLRDSLLDRGVLVETLETAATWRDLAPLRIAIRASLRASLAGTPPLVGCHVSHVYPEGASLYMTVLARRDPADPVAQWTGAKSAATDAILEHGGALSHHHAVGRDHAPWLRRQAGDAGMRALHALRASFDAAGIMNPGKLTG